MKIINEADFLALCSAKMKKDPTNDFWTNLPKVERWLLTKQTRVKSKFTENEQTRHQTIGFVDLDTPEVSVDEFLKTKEQYIPFNQLSTYAGKYLVWRGRSINREGVGDGDWDFGYKVYPVSVLEAMAEFIVQDGKIWKSTIQDFVRLHQHIKRDANE